jgi:hypothetical protein
MAFFGLTALGPQDTFAHHSTASINLHVFEDIDFENAWKATVDKDAVINKCVESCLL